MDTSALPLVMVEWLDSASLTGGVWRDTNDVADLKPTRMRSVGWVLREDGESIVLIGHIASHQVSGDLVIPKTCIKRRYKLADPSRKNGKGR